MKKKMYLCQRNEESSIVDMVIGNGLWAIGDKQKAEAIIGTVALSAMGVYYIVLGMMKDKIQKEFAFTAKKK